MQLQTFNSELPVYSSDVRVKQMMTLPAINTDASKHEKEQISRTVQEMFEEADMWLVSD